MPNFLGYQDRSAFRCNNFQSEKDGRNGRDKQEIISAMEIPVFRPPPPLPLTIANPKEL
jgi:hypothetical protein